LHDDRWIDCDGRRWLSILVRRLGDVYQHFSILEAIIILFSFVVVLLII
jgi:hypothetical protein